MQSKLDYLKVYEDYKNIFNEYEYNYERYKINYSLAMVKLNKNLAQKKICLNRLIRLTDECIKINEEYSMLIFFKTDLKTGFKILYNLEKKLIEIYHLYDFDIDKVFEASIIEKKDTNNTQDMLEKLFYIVENISQDNLIETEEDI